jgi:hypothetical protein
LDLIELNDDLRREPFDTRKATLASLLKRAAPGLRLNEHIEADAPRVRPRSSRSRDWLKCKNPAAPAVKREAEED